MDTFAKRFKQLRNAVGLTQEELLAEFNRKYNRNFGASAVSQYENGKRVPEVGALKDFAKYFDVSVSYLLGETDFKKHDKSTGELIENIENVTKLINGLKVPAILNDVQVAFSGGAGDGLNQDDIDMLVDLAERMRKKNRNAVDGA